MSLTRREFLKSALVAGAAAGLADYATAIGQTPPAATGPDSGELPRRVLGRTKERVTILGLGTAYIANKGRDAIDDAKTRALIEAAYEGGIRYFDTSPDYKDSEFRLGQALAEVRERIFLVTKINPLTAEGAEKEFANSLKLLKTDHVDLLLQHGIGCAGPTTDTKMILGKGGSLEFLIKAKKAGMTRFIGLSIHIPFAPGLALLNASDEWDVVMPFVNYVSRAEINAEKEVVESCRARNIGVTAMKVLGGDGQLANDYDRAFRYTLSVPGLACALVGCRDAGEVKRAVRAARDFRPLTDKEMKETIKLGEEMFKAKSKKVSMLQRHYAADLGGVWLA